MSATASIASRLRSIWHESTVGKAWLFFAVVSLIVNLRMLIGNGVPVHGDLTYPWRIENYFENYRYLFNDRGSISNLESIDRAILLLPISALVRFAGGGADVINKMFFLVLPFVAMVTSYSLNRVIVQEAFSGSRRPRGLILASVVYAFSPWVMEQVQAYLFWLAYALTPLLILLLIRLVQRPGLRLAVAYSVVLTLIATTPQYLVYSLIVSAVVVALELAIVRTHDRGLAPRRPALLRWFTGVAVMCLLLNFYWLYPAVMVLADGTSLSPGYSVDRAMTAMFSTNSTPLDVMRGFDQWVVWYRQDPAMAFTFNRLWMINSLALPLLAFFTFVATAARRSQHLRVLAFLALLFALLSLGTRTPLLDWIMFDLPGMERFGWVFRVPGKMSYMLWVFYAACLSLALSSEHLRGRAIRRWSMVLAVVSCLILVGPKTVRYFFFYYAPVQQPDAYRDLDRFLAARAGDFRVLYLAPFDTGFGKNSLQFETSFKWNPARLAAATPEISSPKPSIGYYHLTYRDWQLMLYRDLSPTIPPDLGERLLAPAGVRYLVYHDDIVGAEGQGARELAQLYRSDLRRVADFGGYLHVFENPLYRQLFNDPDGHSDGVSTVKVDPTRYDVYLAPGAGRSVIMGQPFDAMWRLHAGGATVRPSRARSGLMSFRFPANVSAGRFQYYPQPYYERGLAVSIPVLALALVTMAVPSRRRRGKVL